MQYPQPITKLIESFSKLPGIGNKTAERLAFHVISSMKEDDATTFAKALIDSKRQLFKCPICGHITDTNPCLSVQIHIETVQLLQLYKTLKTSLLLNVCVDLKGYITC